MCARLCFGGIYLEAELLSHNRSMFDILKTPRLFQSGCTMLYSHQSPINSSLSFWPSSFQRVWRCVCLKVGFTNLHSHQRCLCNSTYFSTSSPIIAIINLFKFCFVNMCVRIPHLNLPFADTSDIEHLSTYWWAICISPSANCLLHMFFFIGLIETFYDVDMYVRCMQCRYYSFAAIHVDLTFLLTFKKFFVQKHLIFTSSICQFSSL